MKKRDTMAKKIYVCASCNFAYPEKEKATECEEFCIKHHSCSLEIIKYSIGEINLKKEK